MKIIYEITEQRSLDIDIPSLVEYMSEIGEEELTLSTLEGFIIKSGDLYDKDIVDLEIKSNLIYLAESVTNYLNEHSI